MQKTQQTKTKKTTKLAQIHYGGNVVAYLHVFWKLRFLSVFSHWNSSLTIQLLHFNQLLYTSFH